MKQQLPNANYVSLSEALSWLAFGDARNRENLNRELMGPVFGMSYKEAKAQLMKAVLQLTDAAYDGKVELHGKCLVSHEVAATAALTEEIPSIKLRDFKQFDITVDGLRFGSGLAWLPDENGEYRVIAPNRSEFYAAVVVRRSDIMRVFSVGGASAASKPELPRISENALKMWFDSLEPSQKELPQEALAKLCRARFPQNYVSRRRIRELTPGRSRGRKSIRP